MKTRTMVAVAALAAAAAAALAAGPALAGPDARPRFDPPWAKSWEAALAEAKERNVPILVSFHQDG